jgi:hypothetical protein
MNKLTPDAYSIANLELVELFKQLRKKCDDPRILWEALHDNKAFGDDYFILIIEELYAGRFTDSYDSLY